MEGTLVRFFFLLIVLHTGRAQETVITRAGEDAVLPCRLKPPTDSSAETLEWARPDLDPRFVYVWHEGLQILTDQNAAYRGRAAVPVERLKLGDASLTLYDVTNSDSGRYRCYFPRRDQDFWVDLVVGAVSRPEVTLAGMDRSAGAVLLRCRSAGWYPEPELLWLDAQGDPIPSGPTQTLRGPDGRYTVSSGASVEKRRGNTFTCRVRQSHTNQSRETQQHLPDQFFIPESSCAASIAVSVVASILLVPALVLLTWTFRTQRQKEQQEKKDISVMVEVTKEVLQNLAELKPQQKPQESSDHTDLMAQMNKLVEKLNDKIVKNMKVYGEPRGWRSSAAEKNEGGVEIKPPPEGQDAESSGPDGEPPGLDQTGSGRTGPDSSSLDQSTEKQLNKGPKKDP